MGEKSDPEMSLEVPLQEGLVRDLRVGNRVRVNGVLFTARDAVHRHLAGGGTVPADLSGAVVYHCGPVTVREAEGWRVTAAGPTTSAREEPYMPTLIRRYGLRAVIGKGGMGPATLRACATYGCVYLHAVGGAAQVLAACIAAVEAVYLLETFGAPEALWRLRVADFPAIVTMDTTGASLHADVAERSAARLQHLLTDRAS